MAAILHVLGTAGVHGPVNLTAPEPVTNAEFTATLGWSCVRGTLADARTIQRSV